MNQVTIEFTNLMTGEKRLEIWNKVNTNISGTYQAPDGSYYTHGLIGWMNVDKYVRP
jgi:hypothetical protein